MTDQLRRSRQRMRSSDHGRGVSPHNLQTSPSAAVPLITCRNKRYSRWKTKVQAELAKGPTAAAEGDGDAEAGDGSESPKKTAKATPKKGKAASAETPKKKTPAKKATSAKKRKIDEAEGEGEKVKDEPEDMVSLSTPAQQCASLILSRTSLEEALHSQCCGAMPSLQSSSRRVGEKWLERRGLRANGHPLW